MDIQSVFGKINLILPTINLFLIILGAIFTVRQLKENSRARQASLIDNVFEYISLPEMRKARGRVRNAKLPSNLAKLSTKQRDDFEMVLSGYARVGIMLELGVFGSKDKDILFRNYSLSIDSTWVNLRSYVIHQRQKSGVLDHWLNVELLAKRAHEWREIHKLPTWPRQVTDDQSMNKAS